MENKINIAELLKDCPKGMELNCTILDNIVLNNIFNCAFVYPIEVVTKDGSRSLNLTKYGCTSENKNAKCVIFPKGKTTWEGFVPPCQFKDGDILYLKAISDWVCIYKEDKDTKNFYIYVAIEVSSADNIVYNKARLLCCKKDIIKIRIATEEEKQKLFNAIKANGYRWDNETKTLVEPKFKIEKGKWYVCIKDLLDNYANKAFCKGDIYLSTQDGSLIPSNSNVPFEVFCPTTYFRDWTIQDAKDGDVLAEDSCIFIIQKLGDNSTAAKTHCTLDNEGNFDDGSILYFDIDSTKPASEEEKEKLFRAIKDNGYKWDSENKILEKLTESKENIDDRIVMSDIYFNMEDYADEVELHLSNYEIEIRDGRTYAILKNQKTKTSEKLVKPIFRVGDTIQNKVDKWLTTRTIKSFTEGIGYFTTINDWIRINEQDKWELVPNKFDINTLVPFESRVLVRDTDHYEWEGAVFGRYDGNSFFTIGGIDWKYCIPYEGNEHLFGTTNDCDDFYKTWKE